MTPKEKAKELISKFTFLKTPESDNKFYNPIQCALICVEEINNSLQNIPDLQVSGNVLLDQIKYYQKVKEEINVLKINQL